MNHINIIHVSFLLNNPNENNQIQILSFYNNILIQSKKEDYQFDLEILENIILCINNMIFFNPDKILEYAFGDRKERWTQRVHSERI